ncbi:MAG: NAD(P)/FAD-dependent oxidoreductase [Rhodoferax sp.]|nr:NAD(P)/FAD-dependent oxidoreductase [Rhodoferax sp.]
MFDPPQTGVGGTGHALVHEVVVVGAGFAGIGAAIRLQQAGVECVVLEKGDEIGGVWRDNTYPGCGCDVPSALYSYSFAPNPRWSRLFAKQDEIKNYTRDTAAKFGLLDRVRLRHELTEARWIEPQKCWRLTTTAGVFWARFVVMACGPMHVPVLPRTPGLDTFTGVHFHSSRWDHGFDMTGKRVAVIGSGASAIQFVPHIAQKVRQLTLFQRTAPWVLAKLDAPITPRWQSLFARYPWTQSLFRTALYLQFEMLNASLNYPRLLKRIQTQGIKNIARGVKDPALRAKLVPNYSVGCKRILLSNTWYRALAQPHVQVVPDVVKIDGNTVVASDGSSCEVDALVFATGFEVANPPIANCIIGRSGKTLANQWQGSPAAYLGTMAQDCPNLFLTFGPNLYTFSSAFVIIEAQLKFIVSAVTTARRQGITSIAVQPARYTAYNQQIQMALQHTVWNSGCTSYFLDKNGRNSTNWPWTTFTMRRRLARFDVRDFDIENSITEPSPTP